MTTLRGGIFGPAAFLCLALLIGGSGSDYPLLEMTIEIAAALLLAFALVHRGPIGAGPVAAIVLVLIAALVPMAQLVPLPTGFWPGLPGRAPVAALDHALGTVTARPLSLVPRSTVRHLVALVVPVAAFAATLRLSWRDRRSLLIVVAALAALSAIAGILQVAGAAPYLYDTVHRGYPIGLFINRNHQATAMLIGIVAAGAAAGLEPRQAGFARLIGGGAMLLLAATVLVTTSRLGVALLPVAVIAGVLLMVRPPLRQAWLAVGAVVSVIVLLAFAAAQTRIGDAALARLLTFDPQRAVFWRDTWYATRLFWPIGTGVGSFAPVYASVEDLNAVGQLYVNHAHDEYLEWLLELGIAAPILIVGMIALALYQWTRPGPPAARTIRNAGGAMLLLVAVHSTGDYPVRMLAIATLVGIAFALLFDPPIAPERQRSEARTRRPLAA